MRLIIVGLAAALLLIPAAPVSAAASGVHKMQATDFSGAKKKAKKRKAPKVEYMRAVPAN